MSNFFFFIFMKKHFKDLKQLTGSGSGLKFPLNRYRNFNSDLTDLVILRKIDT